MNPIIWLRSNVTLFITLSGLIVSTILAISDAKHDIKDNALALTRITEDLAGVHRDLAGVDKRLNGDDVLLIDGHRIRDQQVDSIDKRVAVLEAQIRFLADRLPVSSPVGNRR